jgi:hypothetical protein
MKFFKLKKLKVSIFFFAVFVLFVVSGYQYLIHQTPLVKIKFFGVTYSKIQAEALGLDWRKVYTSIFDDLGIRLLRIPVYWSEVEKERGRFDYASFDWMLEKADFFRAKVILVVGRKQPRWPECFEPTWARLQNPEAREKSLLNYIERTIRRYNNNSLVWAWQVENEPFLNFGICPKQDIGLLDREIELARSLSDKPIIITDSGELGRWLRAYKRADIFGTTLYRHVYSKLLGQITYPLPPSFFRFKKGLAEKIYGKKPSFVIELQAEPWGPKAINEMKIEEQYSSMSPEKFNEILEYIQETGFDTFYLWGVEWWYWLKKQGHLEMWNLVKHKVAELEGS